MHISRDVIKNAIFLSRRIIYVDIIDTQPPYVDLN